MVAADPPRLVCGHCGRRYGLRFEDVLGKGLEAEGKCDLCGVSTLVVGVADMGGLKEGWTR